MTETKRSGLGGGLWIILVLLFGGGIFFSIQGWRASHSGSTQQLPGGPIVITEENVGFFQTIGVLGLILIAAGIVAFFIMKGEK